MDFYRKVTTKTNSLFNKDLPNMVVLNQQSKELRAQKAKAQTALENARLDAMRSNDLKDRKKASRLMLEGYKRHVISKLHTYIPLVIMNECFNSIVLKALPHDKEYIEKIAPSLEVFNKVYLHHLGGFKYLKEMALTTKNPFLTKWYDMVRENSDEIISKRINQIQDATSEDDVKEIIKGGLEADEAEKIHDDIEDMSVDDIAELVQNKVLDVVKDESERQAKDAAFRQDLETKIKEYEDQNNKELNVNVAQGEAEDQEDDQNPEDNKNETDTNEDEEPKEAEEPKTESARLGRYLIDSLALHENTLFYSMVHSAYTSLVIANEDAGESIMPKTPTKVLTSPLNLNLFDVYLNDYQNDLADIDSLRVGEKNPIAGSETKIDNDDVLAEAALAEALIHYTVLETAMTIRLINPTAKEVREAANFNMAFVTKNHKN